MALSIKDPEADRLAREVAARTGETITQAVVTALRERLLREQRRTQDAQDVAREAMRIGRHFSALPVRDTRSLEELLYDDRGLPV
jgi:antitoxin VapB